MGIISDSNIGSTDEINVLIILAPQMGIVSDGNIGIIDDIISLDDIDFSDDIISLESFGLK